MCPSVMQEFKVNWAEFQSLCLQKLTIIPVSSTDIYQFTSILSTIADNYIHKSSGKSNVRGNRWFNNDCKKTITKRIENLRYFKRDPTSSNLDALKISRAQTLPTVCQTRKYFWRNYVFLSNNPAGVTFAA